MLETRKLFSHFYIQKSLVIGLMLVLGYCACEAIFCVDKNAFLSNNESIVKACYVATVTGIACDICMCIGIYRCAQSFTVIRDGGRCNLAFRCYVSQNKQP